MTLAPLTVRMVFGAAMIAAIAACGGAEGSAPAKTPESQDKSNETEGGAQPRSITEAQDQIIRARVILEAATKRTDASTTPAPEPPQKAPQAQGGAAGVREERTGLEDSCGSPCRALASMRRAVEALCRITGDGDSRCNDAKNVLSESTIRVASCKCEAR